MRFCVDELLVSFSLWKNSKALFSLDRSPSDVSTIHGIRFINAALLLISHKSMAVFYNPYINRTKMIEVKFNPSFEIFGGTLTKFKLKRNCKKLCEFSGHWRVYISDCKSSSHLYRCLYNVERSFDVLCHYWSIEE